MIGGPAAAAKEPPRQKVYSLLRKYKVPAVSYATFDGDRVRLNAYGRRQVDSSKVTPETRFQAASLSKTANALCVLSLVRDGRLSLDDPVNKHLVGWQLTGIEADKVTIRMLLSHTGGTTIAGFPGYQRDDAIPNLGEVLDGLAPANTKPINVISPPGRAYVYSGGGVVVLQKLVTDLEASPYDEVVARRVLQPLGMTNSSMRQPLQSIRGKLASGHTIDGDVIRMDYFIYPEMAAAGLWSTPGDLARMLMAMLASAAGERGAFLPRELVREMMTPVMADAGLGVFINPAGLVHHDGANWGFRAVYFVDPRKRRGKVIMANGQRGDMVYNELLKQL